MDLILPNQAGPLHFYLYTQEHQMHLHKINLQSMLPVLQRHYLTGVVCIVYTESYCSSLLLPIPVIEQIEGSNLLGSLHKIA